jgi:hypothetical protein
MPADQLKENMDSPRFHIQTAAGQGKLSKDGLMNLFDKPFQTLFICSIHNNHPYNNRYDNTNANHYYYTTTTAASSPLRVPSLIQ